MSLKNAQFKQIKVAHLSLRGPYAQKKNLYCSFDCDEKFCTYVKSKTKWRNRHELFSIFFIENWLFTENVKKGVRGNEPNGRTVQPAQLTLIPLEVEFCALQNYRKFFFEFHFRFRVINFFKKNSLLPKNPKVQTA